jgi:hypothetical protein
MTESLENDRPVFVVGMPRSGTTLMQSLLNAHPNISIAPETHFLNKLVERDDNVEDNFRIFWSDYKERERFRNLNLDAELMEALVRESGDFSYRNVFRTILIQYAASRNKSRWGEKTPSHYVHLERLLTWFPKAAIIVVVRDPRAVCCSLISAYWRKDNQRLHRLEGRNTRRFRRLHHDARTWQLHVQDLATRWMQDERLLVIRYEDLVSDPDSMLRRILTFLNEPFFLEPLEERREADVRTQFDDETRRDKVSWRQAHAARVSGPIDTESVGKWKRLLADREIRVVERVCEDGMRKMRYQSASSDSVGALNKIASTATYLWSEAYWRISRARNAT